ncbi:cytochrome P450 [Cladochytrium replicatum]|nr:cytochrome P450 [Cladochytrium replicatum]
MLLTIVTLAVAFAVISATYFRLSFRRSRAPASIPRPKGWLPILGHGHLVAAGGFDQSVAVFEKWAWELGPIYVAELGQGNETVFISDTEQIQQLMRRRHTETLPADSFKSSLSSLGMPHNIALVEDYDEWRNLRRILETPFTPSNLKKMIPFILRAAKNLGTEFDRIAEMQAAERAAHPRPGEFDGKTAVDLNPILKKTTFDAMMMYAFDLDDNKYSKQLSLEDVDLTTSGVVNRISSVFKLYNYFKTAEDKRVDAAAKRVRDTSFKIIQEAKERVERSGGGRVEVIREHSVLDNFIKSQMPEEQKIGKLSEAMLADNVFALLFAGYDTTASTFGTILRVLAQYPTVQEKVYEEGISVFKPNWEEQHDPFGDSATFDTKVLPYIHAFIKEVNRLYPLALIHLVDTKTDVQLGDYHFAPGTKMMLMARVAALKASSLDDGFKFRPERWIEMEDNKELREAESRTIMNFGGGARICPGRHAAIAQLAVFTAMTVTRFKVRHLDVPPHVALSQSFLNLPVKFEKRT